MTSSTGIPPVVRSPLARALGELLGGAFAVAQRFRHPRPIHSRGVVLCGEMRWIPDATPAGVAFIDDAPSGPVPVVARVSRSLGLPAPLPDIIGLALRVDVSGWAESGGHADAYSAGMDAARRVAAGDEHGREVERPGRIADIEFASTGWNVPARFALLPRRRAERARLGILFPYRGERGPVLLIARTRSGRPAATDPRELPERERPRRDTATWALTLGHATPCGTWRPFAVLDLHLDPDQDDRGLRFDAVRHPLPGARTYAWVRGARQPSYVRVQHDDGPVRAPRTTRAQPTDRGRAAATGAHRQR